MTSAKVKTSFLTIKKIEMFFRSTMLSGKNAKRINYVQGCTQTGFLGSFIVSRALNLFLKG